LTNEIREYAEQEFDKLEVEEEHVHWAPWSSAGLNTSMNYESPHTLWPRDPGQAQKEEPMAPAESATR